MPESDDFDRQVRAEIYRSFVSFGRAPVAADIAGTLSVTPAQVEDSFRRLHDAHLIVWDVENIGDDLSEHGVHALANGGGPTRERDRTGGVDGDAGAQVGVDLVARQMAAVRLARRNRDGQLA